jgi:MurNAc alpha-1-phosphate uridylyltransferase
LAAGAGTRLAPITDSVPKPLCPVATQPLVDLALARLATIDVEPAVNVHHHHEQLRAWIGDRAHVSHEHPVALGTAGALGRLRDWIDGRAVAVVNADTWCPGGLESLVDGWDGDSVRVCVPGGGAFGPSSAIVGTLLPWRVLRHLEAEPTGLYEVVWGLEHGAGRLEVVAHDGPWIDCGRPADLLEANLLALGGRTVVGVSAAVTGTADTSAISNGAVVAGSVTDTVVFPDAQVAADEVLVRCIRWLDGHGVGQTVQL